MNNKKILYCLLMISTFLIVIGIFLFPKNSDPIEVKVTTANDFNSKIIREINKNEESNYLISPYSIEIALNMLRDGANGETKKQIDSLIEERQINNVTIKNRINVANAAFIKKTYKQNVTPKYYQSLKEKYNADILYDEFQTPKVMNDWVNKETSGMIDKITDSLSSDFAMGIANAVAIDVEWKNPFKCEETYAEDFTKADKSKYRASMMHKEYTKYDKVKYFESENEKGIIIPYQNYNKKGEKIFEGENHLEFVGVVSKTEIKDYVSNINDETLKEIDNNSEALNENEKIHLSLPMFKYDYSVSDFIGTLNNLGITNVFNPNAADLSNMIKSDAENFYVSQAIHKTHIDLNEEGTKAAAVTAFIIDKSSAMIEQEEKIIEIKFDKPFAYIIRDTKTKEILFFGVVYEPVKWEGSTCK